MAVDSNYYSQPPLNPMLTPLAWTRGSLRKIPRVKTACWGVAGVTHQAHFWLRWCEHNAELSASAGGRREEGGGRREEGWVNSCGGCVQKRRGDYKEWEGISRGVEREKREREPARGGSLLSPFLLSVRRLYPRFLPPPTHKTLTHASLSISNCLSLLAPPLSPLLVLQVAAHHLEIWTDVYGMFSGDPRRMPHARLIQVQHMYIETRYRCSTCTYTPDTGAAHVHAHQIQVQHMYMHTRYRCSASTYTPDTPDAC